MNRPNVILIVLDTVRADRLSCYGYRRETSPCLDALAREGTVFEEAIAPAPWTLPSHVSMFTGVLPSKHGAHRDHHRFDTPYITLAQLLSETGHHAVGFSNVGWVDDVTGAIRGFGEFHGRETWRKQLPDGDPLGRIRDKGAGRIIDGVKKWIRTREDVQPFFMFINMFEAHNPYTPPSPWDRMYISTAADAEKIPHINQDVLKYYVGKSSMTHEDFRILGDLYDGELRYVDSRLGELVECLTEDSLLDESILIVTSDHGENLGEHGHFEHRYCLYEPVIRVPLLIRYPKVFGKGERATLPVQPMDIYPTVMDLLRIDREDIRLELQGESLIPSARASRQRDFTVSEWMPKPGLKRYEEYPDFDASVFAYGLKAIRRDGYKLIRGSHGIHELYHLEKDPEEKFNLIQESPDKAKELTERLDAWENRSVATTVSTYSIHKDETVDETVRRRLRELGYMD